MVFRSEEGIGTKSFTSFLDKESVFTGLTNMSIIFLILISNIYNTTPNKQILISFFEKVRKGSNGQDPIGDDRETTLADSPEQVFSKERDSDEDTARSGIMDSVEACSFEDRSKSWGVFDKCVE